jgi:hypothetical protein
MIYFKVLTQHLHGKTETSHQSNSVKIESPPSGNEIQDLPYTN